MKFQVIDLTIRHFRSIKAFWKRDVSSVPCPNSIPCLSGDAELLLSPGAEACAWLRLLTLTHWMLVLSYSILCLLREQRPKIWKISFCWNIKSWGMSAVIDSSPWFISESVSAERAFGYAGELCLSSLISKVWIICSLMLPCCNSGISLFRIGVGDTEEQGKRSVQGRLENV